VVHHYLKTLGPLGASILGFEQRATTYAGLRHQEPAVIGSQPSPQPEPFFSSESCELRRADVQCWWRELCIFFDWFTFSSIGHTKGQLLFSGQAHSSLWCLTCLGRQPARWVVYRFPLTKRKWRWKDVGCKWVTLRLSQSGHQSPESCPSVVVGEALNEQTTGPLSPLAWQKKVAYVCLRHVSSPPCKCHWPQ